MTHSSLLPIDPTIATVIDRGPEDHKWIKVRLPNGAEAFCFSDTENTVPVKKLAIATGLSVHQVRSTNKAGPTKYACNALHINLQPSDLAFRDDPVLSNEDFELSAAPIHAKPARRPSVTVPFSKARYELIKQMALLHGFNGKYALSNAVAYMLDTYMRSNSIYENN